MYLRTLGGLELEQSGFTRVKPLLLLAFLCLEGPQERRHVAELFWPTAADGLNSLSRALSQLRQGAPEAVGADETRVWSTARSDAQALLGALERKAHAEVAELYRGAFLEGIFLNDWGAELEEWVYEQRERLASRSQGALLELAEAEASRGRFEAAGSRAAAAYRLKGAPSPEPESLLRYHTLLVAAEHHLASEVEREAESYGVALELRKEEARNRLQTALLGRERERERLEGLASSQWAWVCGAPGMGKTTLLRSLHGGLYLPGRSGLPYATLEPLLGDKVSGGESAMLRWMSQQDGCWLIDGWEGMDAESRQLLQRLRDLRPRAVVIVASRERAPFGTDLELELGPLSEQALAPFPHAWERTGGIPSLVSAFLRDEPLEDALGARLQTLSGAAAQVYLALALLAEPDPARVRRALELEAPVMASAFGELVSAGLVDPSGRVRAEQAASHVLEDQLTQAGELAIRLARELPPLAAFPLYRRARLFWEEADADAIRAAYLAWAQELLRRGSPQRASEVLADAPANDDVSALRARALERAGRFREALDALQGVRETPEVLALKGALYWRLGQPDKARAAAEQALDGELEARAEAFNTLGYLSVSTAQYPEAEAAFKKAAALWLTAGSRSRQADALNNLAVALNLAGKDARNAFAEALEAAGENPLLRARVLLNSSQVDERAGRTRQATSGFREAAELAEGVGATTTAARAWNNLGVLHHKQAEVSQAKAAYEQALRLAQQAGEKRMLGMVMANLAELTGNLEAWQEALRILEQAGHLDAAETCRAGLPQDHPFRLVEGSV